MSRRFNPSLIFSLLLILAFVSLPYKFAHAVNAPMSEVQALGGDQEEGGEQNGEGQSDSTCSPLIEESDSGQDADTGGIDLGLGDLVNAGLLTEELQTHIQGYLKEYNLSASLVGQLLASLLVLLSACVLVFFGKKLLRKALRKARKNRIGFKIRLQRMHFYRKLSGAFLLLILLCLVAMALMVIWSAQADKVFAYQATITGFHLIVKFAFLFALAAAAFELVSAVMEYYFAKWNYSGSARVHTLLPIVRNIANVALFTIFGITLVSELGLNIMPLLAGAGVIGFAIGFGAQTVIKDLITGFILIFEDLIQVGDVATVGGKTGIVEKITIRKIQLRSLSGVVYTVPYSEISVVENMTKDFSYYMFNVGVAYRESPDEVIEILKAIGQEMQEDEGYKNKILEPLEVLGVDEFADSAVVIKARIKTLPIKQWEVGREFNRRIKYRFDELGVEIPFPHQTLYFGQDKSGHSPAAKIELKDSVAESNNDAEVNRR